MKDEMKSGYENLTNKQETMISTSGRAGKLCGVKNYAVVNLGIRD